MELRKFESKMTRLAIGLLAIIASSLSGCRAWLVDQTDRDVYELIDSRQNAALGFTSESRIGPAPGEAGGRDRMYAFVPRPLDPALPDAFHEAATPSADMEPDSESRPADQGEIASETDLSPSIFTPEEEDRVVVFDLRNALAYAMHHARELQDAKEDLYLAALDLTLERHLWTPQFSAQIASDYTDFPDESDTDRALTTVSQAAVRQRLPLGGEISARIIHDMVHQVQDHVAKGETGQAILDAEIPLLRGAGRVAYESRYVAERTLIYAVRIFERFRRSFLVDIAADYFGLQQAKAAVNNSNVAYIGRKRDWEKAEFIHRMGRSRTIFDAPRARANLRSAEADLVSAKERYESALDRFKIRIGMSVDALLDVVDQAKDEEANALDALLPNIDESTAVDVAVAYRLDLLNDADRVDDTRRGVVIAKNQILPDLNLTGSVTFDSDPNQLRPANLREERATWQGGIELRIDDRKTERNAYRTALVTLKRAERDHELLTDTVRADVRQAMRQIRQQENLRAIQELNVEENEVRLDAARAQYDLGRSTNQDVVDAEDDLLTARNAYAAAIAAYRVAVLEFRLATGTLRVSDEGRWETPTSPNG